jgi:sec-independent protein translocase protein TatA
MGSFGLIHWIIFGLFLLLLFGGNRFSSMMKDVAKGLKSFKEGMGEDETKPEVRDERRQLPPQSRAPEQPIDVTPERRSSEIPPATDDQPRS